MVSFHSIIHILMYTTVLFGLMFMFFNKFLAFARISSFPKWILLKLYSIFFLISLSEKINETHFFAVKAIWTENWATNLTALIAFIKRQLIFFIFLQERDRNNAIAIPLQHTNKFIISSDSCIRNVKLVDTKNIFRAWSTLFNSTAGLRQNVLRIQHGH